MEILGQLERKVLRDDVYAVILEMLLDGKVPAGKSLSIDGMARQLGVSPTPIREALAQLEHTGLVTRAALKGYKVAPPLTEEQMVELVDARGVVEVAAIERAYQNKGVLLPKLKRAHLMHTSAVVLLSEQDPEQGTAAAVREYFETDWEFHVQIMRAANNRYLLQMLEPLGGHVHLMRKAVTKGVSDAEQALFEHGQILQAIERGSVEEAVQAMKEHLHGVRSRV